MYITPIKEGVQLTVWVATVVDKVGRGDWDASAIDEVHLPLVSELHGIVRYGWHCLLQPVLRSLPVHVSAVLSDPGASRQVAQCPNLKQW